jgi:hypothetical protein
MSYNTTKHGRAEYGSFMQVPSGVLSSIEQEMDESLELQNQWFARLVYNVAPQTLSLSGATVNVDTVGLDDTGLVQLSGDQLKVFDQGVIDAINNKTISVTDNIYSTVIQTRTTPNGDDTYIAEAPVGTPYSTAGWRVQKIDPTGTTTWADSSNFSQPANIELSSLVYQP